MPTYEYRCPEGHTFDLFQKMSDDPVATCPECGRDAERVLSGGAGFLFKGEGFYITDYRSEEYKRKAAAEKGGGSEKTSGSGDAAGASEKTGSGDAGGSGPSKKKAGPSGSPKGEG